MRDGAGFKGPPDLILMQFSLNVDCTGQSKKKTGLSVFENGKIIWGETFEQVRGRQALCKSQEFFFGIA